MDNSELVLPFKVISSLTPEQKIKDKEIREWLKANRETLAKRTSDEVAQMAIFCGFALSDVCRTLSTFEDAMNDRDTDAKVAMQIWLYEKTLVRVRKMGQDLKDKAKPKVLNLMPLWKDLVDYTITGNTPQSHASNE